MARSINEIRKLYPYSDNCLELQKTIDKIINEKSYYALKMNSAEINVLSQRLAELNAYFDKITCEMLIGNIKLEQVSQIADKYGEIDKIRIEAENKKEVNKRIYIGFGIVLAGLGIVLITNRKKK
jgi:hypothetical protein